MTEYQVINHHSVRTAVMALRHAEHDLARLADLAVLSQLPMEDKTSCAGWIKHALVNVRTALALLDRGGP
jgi:hypothetical protein